MIYKLLFLVTLILDAANADGFQLINEQNNVYLGSKY